MAAYHHSAYATQQTLMMGFPTGGGIGGISDISSAQSFRRAVVRNPPRGEYILIVQPPVKQGSNWHYGGRVMPNSSEPSNSSHNPAREYVIWRKWEDCLELQKILEREYSWMQDHRRKEESRAKLAAAAPPASSRQSTHSGSSGNGTGGSFRPRPPSPVNAWGGAEAFYGESLKKAASFDSLPSGPEPLAMALDVHTVLPRLSKKAALFGRPSPQLLQQRAVDFKNFIDTLFDSPALEEIRQVQDVRDWFGYWRRDKESAKKAGTDIPMSPASSRSSELPIQTVPSIEDRGSMQLVIPNSTSNRTSATSGSSGNSSSSLNLSAGHDISASDDEGDEVLDTFPPTPGGGQPSFAPIIRVPPSEGHTSGNPHSGPRSTGVPSPSVISPPELPAPRTKSVDPAGYYGFSVGGMVAPAPMFRSRSHNGPQRETPPTSIRIPNQYSRPGSSGSNSGTSSPQVSSPLASLPLQTTPRENPVSRQARVQRPSQPPPGNRQGKVFTNQKRPGSANSEQSTDATSSLVQSGPSSYTAAPPMMKSMSAGPHQTPEALHVRIPPRPSLPAGVPHSAVEARAAQVFAHERKRSNTANAYGPKPPQSASTIASTATRSSTLSQQTSSSGTSASYAGSLLHAVHNDRQERVGKEDIGDTASFLDYALPAWSLPQQKAPAPSPSPRKEPPPKRARGGRHSISSIESLLTDNSIDAAMSTLRMAGPTPVPHVTPPTPLPPPPMGLRRSLSTGSSIHTRSTSTAAQDDLFWPVSEQNRERIMAAAVIDEDEDVVDSYFYNPNPPRAQSPVTPKRAPTPGGPDDIFAVKVLFPAFKDCAALVFRLPRATTFAEIVMRLHVKFHEAEGVDLERFARGFRLGYRPGTAKRMSDSSVAAVALDDSRQRTLSTASNTMIDPKLLTIIKGEADWRAAVPQAKEKLILQVVVD